jgi:predicted DNA-binding mobile mystery protein A
MPVNTPVYTMSVRQAVQKQYQAIVDRAAHRADGISLPPEGWLRTVRKALDMSGAQLARRMNVTRARVANIEKEERTGSLTIRTMEGAAAALGCRFVYAIVPETTVNDIIAAQARKKALAIVSTASRHMALESQTLPDSKIAQEVERITADLIRQMPSDFWEER